MNHKPNHKLKFVVIYGGVHEILTLENFIMAHSRCDWSHDFLLLVIHMNCEHISYRSLERVFQDPVKGISPYAIWYVKSTMKGQLCVNLLWIANCVMMEYVERTDGHTSATAYNTQHYASTVETHIVNTTKATINMHNWLLAQSHWSHCQCAFSKCHRDWRLLMSMWIKCSSHTILSLGEAADAAVADIMLW